MLDIGSEPVCSVLDTLGGLSDLEQLEQELKQLFQQMAGTSHLNQYHAKAIAELSDSVLSELRSTGYFFVPARTSFFRQRSP